MSPVLVLMTPRDPMRANCYFDHQIARWNGNNQHRHVKWTISNYLWYVCTKLLMKCWALHMYGDCTRAKSSCVLRITFLLHIKGDDTIQLPIETTAKCKAGNLLWIGGNYPSFQGGGTSKDGDATKRTSWHKSKTDVGYVQVLLALSRREGNFTINGSLSMLIWYMQTCKLKWCAHVVKRVSWLKVNSRARLTLQTIMADRRW